MSPVVNRVESSSAVECTTVEEPVTAEHALKRKERCVSSLVQKRGSTTLIPVVLRVTLGPPAQALPARPR